MISFGCDCILCKPSHQSLPDPMGLSSLWWYWKSPSKFSNGKFSCIGTCKKLKENILDFFKRWKEKKSILVDFVTHFFQSEREKMFKILLLHLGDVMRNSFQVKCKNFKGHDICYVRWEICSKDFLRRVKGGKICT